MECVYKSCHPDMVDIKPDMAEELLQAADQYMLDDLKRLCEASICTRLTVDSLPSTFDLAENFNAPEVCSPSCSIGLRLNTWSRLLPGYLQPFCRSPAIGCTVHALLRPNMEGCHGMAHNAAVLCCFMCAPPVAVACMEHNRACTAEPGMVLQLARRSTMFALEHYEQASTMLAKADFGQLIEHMLPRLKRNVTEQLMKAQFGS